MVGRTVGVIAAASALAANAMLIPPGVQSIDSPVEISVVNPHWQAVKLSCLECTLMKPAPPQTQEEHDQPVYIQGGAASILVNVTTIWGDSAVGLDNYPLYPPVKTFRKASVQIVESEATMLDIREKKATTVPVEVSADALFINEETVAPEGDAVIRINYQILSINNSPVTIDAVEVTCLKGADHKMAILNVVPVPKSNDDSDSIPLTRPSPPSAPSHGSEKPKKQCHLPGPLCHFRDVFEEKVEELKSKLPKKFGGKGCHGKRPQGVHLPSHIRPHLPHVEGGHRPAGHHGRPPKMHDGRPHHRPHHPNFFAHHESGLTRLVKGFLFVLIPVILGMTMGIFVSFVGFLVGRLIVFVWIHLFRGGQRGYASVRLSEEDAEKDEIESVVSEPLPRYSEEAPAYEEKERV